MKTITLKTRIPFLAFLGLTLTAHGQAQPTVIDAIQVLESADIGVNHWGIEGMNYTAIGTYGGTLVRGNSINVGQFTVGGWSQLAPANGLYVGGDTWLNGNVGIGTTSVPQQLSLTGGIGFANQNAADKKLYSPADGTLEWMTHDWAPQHGFAVSHQGDQRVFLNSSGNSFLNGGNVGIGTQNPEAKLNVDGDLKLGTAASGQNQILGANRLLIQAGEKLYLNPFAPLGDVIVGGGDGNANLFVTGDGSVRTLTIRGGADLAEPFHISTKDIPKGAVVVIDDENPGQLKISDRAYDSHVAGIVSGANGINPGISLHQEGAIEGDDNLALSGRVYALADAANCPIKPGDLLTTSSTPGHCMKVIDHARSSGTILGKAMSRLQSGRGLVLVLVSLQ